MIEKYSATEEQLKEVQNILKLLEGSLGFVFENGNQAIVEVNHAYLNDDYSIKLEDLSDNPEDNAGFVNINNCEYYIHFGTLINSRVKNNMIFFPGNKVPIEYRDKGLDYLYLNSDLILFIKQTNTYKKNNYDSKG